MDQSMPAHTKPCGWAGTSREVSCMAEHKLLTISEMAYIHNITRTTLIYYDKIGLFQPETADENGYRYYSYQQSAALETILMLRELNVSLDEIGHFMSHRTIDSFDVLLKAKPLSCVR